MASVYHVYANVYALAIIFFNVCALVIILFNIEKVNGCSKSIYLRNIFRNFLQEKKKKIDIFLWLFMFFI